MYFAHTHSHLFNVRRSLLFFRQISVICSAFADVCSSLQRQEIEICACDLCVGDVCYDCRFRLI